MARRFLFAFVIATIVAGCGRVEPHLGDDDEDAAMPDGATPDAGVDAATDGGPTPDAPTDAGPVDYPFSDLDVGCAPIFAQNIVPEYHVTIAPDVWATMEHEFMNPQFTPSGTLVEPPYHPMTLRIDDGTTEHQPTGVVIRLNGNTSWLQAIAYDANPKMQFLIAFNKVDSDGRFQGMRKIKLDMPRSDWTFLQQRVGLAWLRGRAGIPAQCANSARVFINGAYYGLYTNVEFQDKSFLKRVYGDDDDNGDLWKAARDIKTNEETFSWTRITAFWNAETLAGLDTWIDLDESMVEWVSEAIIGDSDGYNYGRPNFYVYDRPSSQKFVWVANDLDTVMDEDFLSPRTTPLLAPTPPEERRWERDWHHYLVAMNDPAAVPRYVQAMRTQLPKLDPAEVQRWVDDWSAQIAAAAEQDPHRTITMAVHSDSVARMKMFAVERKAYLQEWVDCWNGGGVDADGDGYDMCRDCADGNAFQSPGAAEVCDEIDNNCNGRVDDVAGMTCESAAPESREEAMWRRALVDKKAEARARAMRP